MEDELRRAHSDLDETHWWFRGRRRIIEAVLAHHVPDGDGDVLDLGCGAGGLLDLLGRYGPVTAIEGDPVLAAIAAARHPAADVRVLRMPAPVGSEGRFRLVTAFDVIEHLDDDVAALRSMHRALRPSGVACVTVPAVQALWSVHDEANGHRRRYDARSLTKALTSSGFGVVHLSYFNTLLFPAVAAVRLVERFRPPSERTDFDRSPGFLGGVLARVFASERHLVSRVRVPIGVSLVAVATPR